MNIDYLAPVALTKSVSCELMMMVMMGVMMIVMIYEYSFLAAIISVPTHLRETSFSSFYYYYYYFRSYPPPCIFFSVLLLSASNGLVISFQVLPQMLLRRSGHVVVVSSVQVPSQPNPPPLV
jgi:hypothetical protein